MPGGFFPAYPPRLRFHVLSRFRWVFLLTGFVVSSLVNHDARADLWWDTNGAAAGSSNNSVAPGTFSDPNWTTDPTGKSATQVWIPGETAVFAAGTNVLSSFASNVSVTTPSIDIAAIKTEEGYPYLNATGKTITNSTGSLTLDVAAASKLQIQMLYGPTISTITKNGDGWFDTVQDQTTFAGKWVVNGGIIGFHASSLSIAEDLPLGKLPSSVVPDQVTLNNGARILGYGGTMRGITLGPGGGGFGNDGTTTDSKTWSGPITGTSGGPLIVDGKIDEYIYNHSNNYDGDTIIKSGSLHLGASEVIPDTSSVHVLGNSILSMPSAAGSSETVKSIEGSGTIYAGGFGTDSSISLTIQNPSGEIFSGDIYGRKFVKNGSGTITFTGGNNLNEFVLNSGTVGVGSDAMFGRALTINGGTLANNSSTVRHFASGGGTANINADFSVDDSLSTTPGTIELDGFNVLNTNAKITVKGNATLLLKQLSQNASGRTLTKDGPGTLEIGGTTTSQPFSGAVTVLAGKLQIDGIAQIGTGSNVVNLAGGTLNFTTTRNVGNGSTITNPINVTADTAITSTSTFWTVVPFTASSFNASAKITFRNDAPSGASEFNPTISAANSGFSVGPIEIANGAFGTTMLTSLSGLNATQTYPQEISGTGSFQVNGFNGPAPGSPGGTFLTATNTYSGGTTVTGSVLYVNNATGSGTGSGPVSVGTYGRLGGTGSISGAVTNAGTISPGTDVGTLTVNNDVSMSAGSHLSIDLSGATADKLAIGGNLDLSAADYLDVTGAGAGPWIIATYAGTLSGTFDNVTPGYAVDYTTPGEIILNSMTLPGDYNNDGVVDEADYITWRKTPNKFSGDPAGFTAWRANFGASIAAGSNIATVPESPVFSLLATLLVGLCTLIRVRRVPLAPPVPF